jgi:hypothetical protein
MPKKNSLTSGLFRRTRLAVLFSFTMAIPTFFELLWLGFLALNAIREDLLGLL